MKKYTPFLFLLTTASAWAHTGHEESASGFIEGLTHPISGLDHILAMMAVGLWAASFAGKARWAIPAAFVAMMSAGFIFGVNGGEIPLMEQGIAASVLVIGLAAAWAKHAPVALAMSIVGAFALFHGVAHGAELHGSAWQFGIGFVISTAALHLAGYGIGAAIQRHIWLTRAIGTIIGVVGLGLLFT